MVMSIERFEGCLLGLACGDAVGAAVEFLPRGRFAPLTTMTGGGKFRLRKGEWTDDTAMALCLAESLLECGGFDPLDQMQRYWRWANEGHNSCRPQCHRHWKNRRRGANPLPQDRRALLWLH